MLLFQVAFRVIRTIVTSEEAGIKRQVFKCFKILSIYLDDYRWFLINEKCTRKEEFKKGIALNENIIEAIPSAMILNVIMQQSGNFIQQIFDYNILFISHIIIIIIISFHSSWILSLLCNRPRLFILSHSIKKFRDFISTWTCSYLEEWSGQSAGKWRRLWWYVCWTVHLSVLCLLPY